MMNYNSDDYDDDDVDDGDDYDDNDCNDDALCCIFCGQILTMDMFCGIQHSCRKMAAMRLRVWKFSTSVQN